MPVSMCGTTDTPGLFHSTTALEATNSTNLTACVYWSLLCVVMALYDITGRNSDTDGVAYINATDTTAPQCITCAIMSAAIVYTTSKAPPVIGSVMHTTWPSETDPTPPLYFNGRVVCNISAKVHSQSVVIGVCVSHPVYHGLFGFWSAQVCSSGVARVLKADPLSNTAPGTWSDTGAGTVVVSDARTELVLVQL